MSAPPGNPFSTRCVRPGALPFLFPEGESAGRLVERLRGHGWQGQIVGPHGSGKSTLLACLVPELERAGRQVVPVELHDWDRRLPFTRLRGLPPGGPTLVAIDGFEQLGRWQRFRVRRLCRRRGWGLLVTSHAPAGLPDLYHTEFNLGTARRVIDHLLAGRAGRIPNDVLARSLAAHPGNLREALFDLYDHIERRRTADP